MCNQCFYGIYWVSLVNNFLICLLCNNLTVENLQGKKYSTSLEVLMSNPRQVKLFVAKHCKMLKVSYRFVWNAVACALLHLVAFFFFYYSVGSLHIDSQRLLLCIHPGNDLLTFPICMYLAYALFKPPSIILPLSLHIWYISAFYCNSSVKLILCRILKEKSRNIWSKIFRATLLKCALFSPAWCNTWSKHSTVHSV